MTAVEVVRMMWRGVAPNEPNETALLDVLCDHGFPVDEVNEGWIERNNEIMQTTYSRERDRARAWKRNDLRLARVLDEMIGKLG